MFTNFTCSSYLIIWHIKIQLNHWQWHNNQWKWKWNTQSEISLCHHSTSINWDKHWFLYMCSEEMEFNKINEWSEKLSAQRKTSNTGPKVGVRVHPTGVKEQVWQKQQQKTLWFGLLIKGGSSHKSPTAAQFVSLLSSTTTKCLVVSIKDTQGNLPTP